MNWIVHIILLVLGEIWSYGSNLTSLFLVEVFAETLNIKSYQPRQKHCRGSAQTKCIFIVTSEFYMPRQKMLKFEGCGFCFSCIFICKFQSLCNLPVTLLFLFGLKCLDFFSIWVLFHEHSWFTGQQQKGEAISLTLLYHFHLLHRHSLCTS